MLTVVLSSYSVFFLDNVFCIWTCWNAAVLSNLKPFISACCFMLNCSNSSDVHAHSCKFFACLLCSHFFNDNITHFSILGVYNRKLDANLFDGLDSIKHYTFDYIPLVSL